MSINLTLEKPSSKEEQPVQYTKRIDDLIEDAEIHLAVKKNDATYLEHTFQVKGCSEETLPQLAQAMAQDSSEQMICTMEKGLGTRIKKRVCRTEAQMEKDRDMMEQGLRR